MLHFFILFGDFYNHMYYKTKECSARVLALSLNTLAGEGCPILTGRYKMKNLETLEHEWVASLKTATDIQVELQQWDLFNHCHDLSPAGN